ncbi:MAG: kinase, partial [Gemmatimonadetes bacterium]|nr:kinase [Gemmatimonadota bacterium]
GQLLHEHWTHKKRMSSAISVGVVDTIYDEVRERFGVLGGKIIGAGGGGFLMCYVPDDSTRLEDFMLSRGLPRMHYRIEHEGVKVVANLAASEPLIRSSAGEIPARGSAHLDAMTAAS